MGYWERVKRVVGMADLVLEILDGRFPQQTRNSELENMIKGGKQQLLLVINKSDFISKNKANRLKMEMQKDFPCVFVSTKERQGVGRLRNVIGSFCKKEKNKVAIVGYPNTGKSSVLNMLAGRKAALTSIKAGFTKGEQLVRLSERVYLIDSPGIIPYKEDDEFKLVLVCAKNADQVKDTETTALKLIEFVVKENEKGIKELYGIDTQNKNSEEILEELAIKKGKLLSGGKADTENTAKILIMDWQKGKLRV